MGASYNVTFELAENNCDKVIELKDEAIARALEKIGIAGETYAKAKCPVGTPESTGKKRYIGGTLRNSISHTRDADTAYIGTNVEYAIYVEMGTIHMNAKPYLKPAIVDHIDEYKSILESELKNS